MSISKVSSIVNDVVYYRSNRLYSAENIMTETGVIVPCTRGVFKFTIAGPVDSNGDDILGIDRYDFNVLFAGGFSSNPRGGLAQFGNISGTEYPVDPSDVTIIKTDPSIFTAGFDTFEIRVITPSTQWSETTWILRLSYTRSLLSTLSAVRDLGTGDLENFWKVEVVNIAAEEPYAFASSVYGK